MAPEKVRTVFFVTNEYDAAINTIRLSLFDFGKIMALAGSLLVALRSGRKAIQMFAVRKDNYKHGKEFTQIITPLSRRMETAE